MPEQLNERERWLIEVATAYAWGCGGAMEPLPTTKELIDKIMRRSVDCPPDPNLARITEFEAEVERLNALLDVIEAVLLDDFDLKTERCEDILSRRTVERKEPTDASD